MNKQPTIQQFYNEILSKSAEVDASDQLYPTTKTGFFKLVNAKGKSLGFAFYCPRCRTSAGGLDENAVIRHCGKESRVPTSWLAKRWLPKFTLNRQWF